jgi:uncharacterized protein (DUF433 family)
MTQGRKWEWHMKHQQPLIVSDPDICNGEPVFAGTRVMVQSLIDYIEGGETLDEFLEQFPTVTREMAVRFLEEAEEALVVRINASIG